MSVCLYQVNKKVDIQAGAELCQAQGKLRLEVFWFNLVNYYWLIMFGFTNSTYEFSFAGVILSLWKVLEGLAC